MLPLSCFSHGPLFFSHVPLYASAPAAHPVPHSLSLPHWPPRSPPPPDPSACPFLLPCSPSYRPPCRQGPGTAGHGHSPAALGQLGPAGEQREQRKRQLAGNPSITGDLLARRRPCAVPAACRMGEMPAGVGAAAGKELLDVGG